MICFFCCLRIPIRGIFSLWRSQNVIYWFSLQVKKQNNVPCLHHSEKLTKMAYPWNSTENLITQTPRWIWHLAPRKNWKQSNLRINRKSDFPRLNTAVGKLKPQHCLQRSGTLCDVDRHNPTQCHKCPSRFLICANFT